VRVKTARIDDFLAGQQNKHARIALWIDVEGAAYDVLSGMGKDPEKVALVHVEVEKKPMFPGQKLATDIDRLMSNWGFGL